MGKGQNRGTQLLVDKQKIMRWADDGRHEQAVMANSRIKGRWMGWGTTKTGRGRQEDDLLRESSPHNSFSSKLHERLRRTRLGSFFFSPGNAPPRDGVYNSIENFRFWVCSDSWFSQRPLPTFSKLSFWSLSVPFELFIFSPTCFCVFLAQFCFKNRAILRVFVDLVFMGSLRPTHPSPQGVRSFLFVFSPSFFFLIWADQPPRASSSSFICSTRLQGSVIDWGHDCAANTVPSAGVG